eukprot:816910-Prymnesium_polylepis.2
MGNNTQKHALAQKWTRVLHARTPRNIPPDTMQIARRCQTRPGTPQTRSPTAQIRPAIPYAPSMHHPRKRLGLRRLCGRPKHAHPHRLGSQARTAGAVRDTHAAGQVWESLYMDRTATPDPKESCRGSSGSPVASC